MEMTLSVKINVLLQVLIVSITLQISTKSAFPASPCYIFVEAVRKTVSIKKNKLQNRETVHVIFCKFWIVDVTYLIAEQLNWSYAQFVCA